MFFLLFIGDVSALGMAEYFKCFHVLFYTILKTKSSAGEYYLIKKYKIRIVFGFQVVFCVSV